MFPLCAVPYVPILEEAASAALGIIYFIKAYRQCCFQTLVPLNHILFLGLFRR